MNQNVPEQALTSGQSGSSQQRAKRGLLGNARILSGVIAFAILLFASVLTTLFVLAPARLPAHASGGAPTPTPTVSTPAPGQPLPHGSLYTAAAGSLAGLDLRTGNVLWTLQASVPLAPLVMGNTLFYENADQADTFLEAVNAKTGAQLWRTQQYPAGFLLGSGNELYDSACNLSAASDPCHLYGINAGTGAQLWSYDLPQGNAWIAFQHGILYGVSYTTYFALNAFTGTPLWQKDLLNYPDQEANMAPVVSGNILSFASCNTTKQSNGFAGCYLYAFNAGTGEELWHLSTTSTLAATPTILGGVIYAGAIDGSIYALNEQDGTQLWSANAGGTVGQLLSRAGTVYVETIAADGQSLHIEAFNAATHMPIWGQVSDTGATVLLAARSTRSAGPASHPFVLDRGLIYLQSSPTTIAVLNASNGSQVTQYTASQTALNGFTVSVR